LHSNPPPELTTPCDPTQTHHTSTTPSGFNGFPANPNLTSWRTPPYNTDLYSEHLTPAGGLFQEQPMWWEDLPSHPGLFFVRGMTPKHNEDARSLDDHNTFPVSDGPRGIGWVSPYIQGIVDGAGRLVFAETSGRVGWLLPTGEIYTLAGWTLAPNRTAVWIRKPLDAIRGSQELRGGGATFTTTTKGFGRPLDVAFDRSNPFVLYVPDLTLHCIWRMTINGISDASDIAARPTSVDVDVLAGSCSTGGGGFADGVGASARFNAPFSATFARGALFVSDSANHAIRRVDVATGNVTTVWGRPDFQSVLEARGADPFDRAQVRAVTKVVVTSDQAAAGTRPEIYWPGVIRARSDGSLVLLEHGIARVSVVVGGLSNSGWSGTQHPAAGGGCGGQKAAVLLSVL